MTGSLPDTYMVIFAFLEDGTFIKKFFGANEQSTGQQIGAMKTRPYFNDARFGWETMNTSQILFHFYNHQV